MTDLNPICALGGTSPRSLRQGGVILSENTGLELASLALRRDVPTPRPFGLALPAPGLWARGDGIAALWTGRDQWLIEAPGRAGGDLAASLEAEVPGAFVTGQTDSWVVLEIEAPRIEPLMERLINVDAARFLPGSATRTILHHMAVIVVRRTETRLALFGARSMAGSLWHCVETALALGRN